jgi:hypothetical protein
MVAVTAGAERRTTHRFYVGMAALYVLIAFGGFIPTYWAKLAAGTFNGAPIAHIQGALFFLWTLFFFAQTWLVASGRTPDHRMWGMAGISLATAMSFTVVLGAIDSIKGAPPEFTDAARRFAIVPLFALVIFVVFFAFAIGNVRRPEIHKRLMMVAMVPLMHAAIFRIFKLLFASPDAVGPPPAGLSFAPGIVADLLIVAAMIRDWRTQHRIHPVYAIGLPVLLVQEFLNGPVSMTPAWMSVARWLESLAGSG